jgi:hypothetical protein
MAHSSGMNRCELISPVQGSEALEFFGTESGLYAKWEPHDYRTSEMFCYTYHNIIFHMVHIKPFLLNN